MLRKTITRRMILTQAAGASLVSMVSTQNSFAAPAPQTKNKLVVIILRGAMDGLGAVQRINDDLFQSHRPALVDEKALSLSGGFFLNSNLQNLHDMFQQKQASIVHAIAGPWRDRSHFLAQDLLESGTTQIVKQDGWLNRALQVAPSPLSAVSIGPVTPLILRGAAATTSWAPSTLPEVDEDTASRLLRLYDGDALLGPALERAMALDEMAGSAGDKKIRGQEDLALLKATGKLLSEEAGPDIAVVGLGGWDTHANQAGALGRRLLKLDNALGMLRTSLGSNWARTSVLVVTEFGRTVRQNGTKGTDHGTAGAAFILGGAGNGGKVLGDWPGLRPDQLYQNRDLFPANDMRSLFKAILIQQFGFSQQALGTHVFPDSVGITPLALR